MGQMFADKTNIDRGTTTANVDAQQAEPPSIQRKLAVGSVNDPMEDEADATADRVMRMPDGFVQRKCAECEKEEQLQRKEGGRPGSGSNGQPAVSEGTDQAIRSSAGKGSSMDGATQSFMSSRMGHDFSNVKIHTDGAAVQMSRELSARAFTVGRDIYFNEGEYQPGSHDGRHLLAHELTHTVQQGGSPAVVQKKDKLETDKDAILDALHKNDALTFLSRLRALDPAEATSLLADQAFWQEIRSKFRGSALWSAFSILFFHGNKSLPQRQLALALFSKKITDAMDALATIIARENVADPMFWDVLEEVIFTVFEGDPKLIDLFRMIILKDSATSGPRGLGFSSNEVHYEQNAAGAYQMQHFGGNLREVAYTTTNEFRVVVTIRFVDGNDPSKPYYFRGEKSDMPDKWADQIRSVWNNRFELNNGVNKLRFTVSPVFTYEAGQEDATVSILDNRTQTCPGMLQAGRANAGCWFADSKTAPDTISHEFGHLLGANDEYNLPGSAAEIPANLLAKLSADDLKLTTMTGIKNQELPAGATPAAPLPAQTGGYTVTGQMGTHHESTEVRGRHIMLLIKAFNDSQPPGTPPYVIKQL